MEACTQKGQRHKQGHTPPAAWGWVADSVMIPAPVSVTSGTLTLQTQGGRKNLAVCVLELLQ